MTASAYREAVERVPSAHGWWSRLWPIVLMGQIIGTLSLLVAFRVGKDAGGDSPLLLLDPRLVFLAGSDAVPLYLSKFAAYERALHPNVAALQLAAFVDAIAPFLDARVGAWLEGLTKHVHVGRQAEDWLQARR